MLVSGDREEEVAIWPARLGSPTCPLEESRRESGRIVRQESRHGPTLFLVTVSMMRRHAGRDGRRGVRTKQRHYRGSGRRSCPETSLGKVDELMHIGRRMRRIALQSAIGGMTLSIAGMIFAAAGVLPPIAGAIAQEIIDAAAVLNALRVALPSKNLKDEGI